MENAVGKRRLGLYLHIPFCKSKCAYCDFYSFVPKDEGIYERFTSALIGHIESYGKSCQAYSPDTVFLGGGTPTALPLEDLLQIIRAVKKNFDLTKNCEFTVEANPATVDRSGLNRLRRAGVNRLSMGLQSAHDHELAALSRIHKRSDFEEAYYNARAAKIGNINVDVMYGIPGQTVESCLATLKYVADLAPEHISFYNLKIEPGTPFAKMRDTLSLPGEDAEYEMYIKGSEYLASRGYVHYEISNFAKPGYRCQHNLKYWNLEEYLGLGPGAHSFFNGTRFSFFRDVERYIRGVNDPASRINITETSETVRPRERIGEYVMLRMRLAEGVNERDFSRLFGMSFIATYGRLLEKYRNGGFVIKRGDSYAFTPRGMFVSNYILSDILDFSDTTVYDPTK